MGTDTKRILVVEDEEKIVEFIESYLLNSGYEVYKASTGLEGLEIFKRQKIDLILLDLMLPDISGEEVCKEIRKNSGVLIIMLTAKSSDENIIDGLDMGADDYIVKPFSPRQMIARVNALFRRMDTPTSQETSKTLPGRASEVVSHGAKESDSEFLSFNQGDLTINMLNYTVKKSGTVTCLTPSEYKILTTLAKRPNKVFTREELIQVAFDGDYDGYDRTIDSHVKNLRAKIEDNPKDCTYIITIRGIGYRFGGE